MFGLLGPNGSGKTTTLRILATLIRPTIGSASVLGHDVVAEAMEVRRVIGVMPEKPSLYERLTIRDNLSFWADAHAVPRVDDAIARALEFVGLGVVARASGSGNSRKAGGSGSRSPARLSISRRCCSSMSHPPASIPPRRPPWNG
ncbi:MAG: ATP-binding cassette domain-containing protein [Dehalococcoidia bacterium]|uniref:ATP-binding cassette domain-containing protein n=1 Tax=Candidatus Amarobacter glycogenicus TaxID=3140699 RepID=UPI0031348131|nr:ATP-binding cassette domain-containing protein [Dehalococcoidia bacterium]